MVEEQKTSNPTSAAAEGTEAATLERLEEEGAPVVDTAEMEPGDPAPGETEVELTEDQIEARAQEVGVRADLFDEDDYTIDEYEALLEMYEETLHDIVEGEIVRARVLGKTDSEVILDVGFKSEGTVPLEEFRDPDAIETGDEVEVFLESLEDEEGVVVLSKKKADFLRVWEKIKSAFDNDEPVPGTIKRKIKGGVTVDLMGVDAFLPGSQIALRRVPNVEDFVGREFEFKILKLNKRRRNIVISRRALLEEEREEKKKELKEVLEVGQVREGIVKNITDFGAFIDLGGMDGLLHITDMSWGRIGHPSEVCEIGETIQVQVLDVDWDRERISLGLKQLQPYPWKNVAEKYPVGSRVKGRVVSITNYGAFVELEKGVEGLVHISEMSWTRNVRHPSQLVSIGEEIECAVLRVDEEDQKISLGMKQIEEDPWLSLPARYPPGTKIKGVVRNLTSFGAFVEVEPGIDGLVHISDMSWTRRVQHPSEVTRKGEEVEVVVLSIDPEQKRISLGLKQVEEDPWYDLAQRYEPGREVTGALVRLLEKGVVVDLGDNVEGFVPISQLGIEEHIDQPSDRFVEGDQLELRVLETDPINRRIVLSVIGGPEREPGELEAEAPSEVADEVETSAGSESEVEAALEVEPETDPEAEAQTDPEAEAQTDPEAEAQTDPEAEAQIDPEAEGETDPKAEAEPEDEAPGAAGSEAAAGPASGGADEEVEETEEERPPSAEVADETLEAAAPKVEAAAEPEPPEADGEHEAPEAEAEEEKEAG